MAYTLSDKCAKNLSKRTVLLQPYHQKRGHMFFFGSRVYTQDAITSLLFIAWPAHGCFLVIL